MKDSHTKGFVKVGVATAISAALAACGGGGGSGATTSGGGSSSTSTASTQLTGKAIDGYLAGATVCLDNGAGACDASQPSTTTDANGNYTLNVSGSVTGKQIDVIVTPSTTDGGNTFSSTFTLSAIVNGTTQNVTPLTTMVVAQMNTGATQAQATQTVQALAGSNVDPNADYVANGDSATTALAASMVSQMESLAGQGAISWSQVQATMNAYAANGTTNIEPSDVAAQLANPAFSQPTNATTALATSLYTVDGDLFQQIPNAAPSAGVSPLRENWTLSGSTLSMTQEVQSNGSWSAISPVGSYDAGLAGNFISFDSGIGAYEMKADGTWTSFLTNDQLHPSYSLSTVGSNLVGTDPNTGDTITVSYRTADVSGLPLSSALQIDYRNPIRQAMTGAFPSGTTAYLATTKHTNDQLIVTAAGFGMPWINGAVSQTASTMLTGVTNFPNGLDVYSLGDPTVTYTSVQQAVGTQTTLDEGCSLLDIEANGVAQIVESGQSGCNYSAYPWTFPVTGSWSAYGRNANVITISLPKTIGAPNVPINDTVKNTINAGGSLVVALINGKLMGGYMLPASAPVTVPQFPTAMTDTIAASMRAAAIKLGFQQNP